MKEFFTLTLCGCPNSGKTTLFNLLTGEARKTGNRAGVTVDVGRGRLNDRFSPGQQIQVTDLPGIFSLYPHSPEERAALDYLKSGRSDAVVVVIDSCAPAQGLYLALQLMPLGLPMLLAFNMADRLAAEGGAIKTDALSRALCVPCIQISARRSEHIPQLINAALAAKPCKPEDPIPFEESASLPRRLALASRQFDRIDQLLLQCFSYPAPQPALHSADRVALHPLAAYPLLFILLAGVFFCVFGTPGQALFAGVSSLFDMGLAEVSALLTRAHTPPLLFSLLTEGLLQSVAGVLSFLPLLLLFFFTTALLEDSGYLSRAAFLLDAPLARIGLSGRSFFSLVTGFGCSVPAILSTRTLPDRKERRRALLLIPCLPCSAKLPVCLFLASCCFSSRPGYFLILCYLLCFLCFLIAAVVSFPGKGETLPLMNEMPAYHLPTLKSAWNAMKTKTRDYMARAFTVIFFTSLIIWFLKSFTPSLRLAEDISRSLLFSLSHLFRPVFAPLGFSSPYAAAALISGLLAKENILAVLLISPGGEALFPSSAAALSFLVFSLLYAPCLAACAAWAQEMKSRKRMLAAVFVQTVFAWLAAWMVFTVFSR